MTLFASIMVFRRCKLKAVESKELSLAFLGETKNIWCSEYSSSD